jgi:hypothetical protein
MCFGTSTTPPPSTAREETRGSSTGETAAVQKRTGLC